MTTILIIDDDDQLRKSFEKLLIEEGYRVRTAVSGEAGLQEVRAEVPDLVILLTMDPEVSIARIREGRGEELNDFEQLDQLRRVADLFTSFPHLCITRIDADRPLDQVQDDIRHAVQNLLDSRARDAH